MTQAAQATSQKETLRGGILEVLEVLVPEQRGDEIIAVVKKLVARNGELERRLTELLSRRRSSEGVVYDAVMACNGASMCRLWFDQCAIHGLVQAENFVYVDTDSLLLWA